jgi:hypothetical protein
MSLVKVADSESDDPTITLKTEEIYPNLGLPTESHPYTPHTTQRRKGKRTEAPSSSTQVRSEKSPRPRRPSKLSVKKVQDGIFTARGAQDDDHQGTVRYG